MSGYPVANDLEAASDTKDDTMVTVDNGNPEAADKPSYQNGIHDAVWGHLDENTPKYRNLGWIRASVVQLKTQIGLGVLSLPAVFLILGYVPAIIVILVVGAITAWTNYVIGIFKLRHPECYSLPDVGFLIGGKVGQFVMGFSLWILNAAIAGVGMLGFTVAFNTITEHGACTVVWYLVASVIICIVASIQTLDKISWVSWVGLTSVMTALMTLLVAVGVESRPSAAPPTGEWHKISEAAASPSFIDAMNAVSIVVFAYCGTPNYLNIIGEMRNPKDYTKWIIISQTFLTVVYIVFGGLVYHFVGQYIASPALGSAGPLLKKVCYGLALPGLIAGCVLYTHINAKFIFVRLFQNSVHLTAKTKTHYLAWVGCIIGNCALAFIIAEAVPFFGDLVSLVGALPGTLICIQAETYMWMWDNWHSPLRAEKPNRWRLYMAINMIFHLFGWFALITGAYAAIVTINSDEKAGFFGHPFSCKNNAG